MGTAATAYHEAGHAVVAFFSSCMRVNLVTILEGYAIPDAEAKARGYNLPPGARLFRKMQDAHCEILPVRQHAPQRPFQQMQTVLAGPIAERRFTHRSDRRGVPEVGAWNYLAQRGVRGHDLELAQRVAAELKPLDLAQFLRDSWRVTHGLVARHWPQVKAVAAALIREETLDGARLQQVIEGATKCPVDGESEHPERDGRVTATQAAAG